MSKTALILSFLIRSILYLSIVFTLAIYFGPTKDSVYRYMYYIPLGFSGLMVVAILIVRVWGAIFHNKFDGFDKM